MNCTHCNYDYEQNAQYCPQCGNKTLFNPTMNAGNPNVTAVWIYAALLIGVDIWYRLLSHVLVPAIEKAEGWENIGKLYKTTGLLVVLAELVASGIIIAIIKNTSARIAVGLVALFSLLGFVLDRVMMG